MPSGASVNSDINLTASGTAALDVLGLDDLKVTADLQLPQPLVGEASLALSTPEGVRADLSTRSEIAANTNSDLKLDVKPLVFDIRLSLGQFTPIYARLPYHHHFGITLFGIELFGFTLSGESRVDLQDTPFP